MCVMSVATHRSTISVGRRTVDALFLVVFWLNGKS